MTIRQAKELLKCSRQAFYYYKKIGKIHIIDGQIDDNEVWAIYDSKIKPVTEKDQDKMRISLLKLAFELRNKDFSLYDLAYALLKTDLLSPQQVEILCTTLEL